MSALDALLTAGRVLRAGAGVALDDARAIAAGLPRLAEQITPAWLDRVLAPSFPGVRVAACEILDAHSGTTSRARIGLRYAEHGRGASTPPATMFIKLTPRARLQRVFLAATGIGRNELAFYRTVRAGLPVRAPLVYGTASVGPGRQFVLVLEDLAAAGARLTTIGDRLDEADAGRIVEAMAALHACYWESPRFHGDLSWLPHYERRVRELAWERFLTGQMVDVARRRFEGVLGPALGDAAALVIGSRDRLEKLWSEGPRTLIHGDSHVGNLFFLPPRDGADGASEIGFLDWQVCARAPGMRDVTYLLCNSLSSELREKHERELIARYLEALRSHGVAAPSFDAAWRQHRLFALYTFIAAAFTAAAGERLQPRAISEAGLRRATEAVASLDSIRCANEPPAPPQ